MGALFSKVASSEPPKEGYTNISGVYFVLFVIGGVLGLIFILRLVLCPNNRKNK
jgi:hypothetical protein